jgi:RNA polymerase sigma-70 factor, ECF subfamily
MNPALDPTLSSRLAAARAGDEAAFSGLTEPHRRELQVHCYRILGSLIEAEDLVQETLLRAWRRLETFEGRASFRAWLYKIATNACLDALDRRRTQRTLPHAVTTPSTLGQPLQPPVTDPVWLEPLPDDLLADVTEQPEAKFTAHESVTLAFMVALQSLPPRQRAVVILCDVLDWKAAEAADCLEMTVSAVNSALHRGRETLALHYHGQGRDTLTRASDPRTRHLLDRFVNAWEAADVDALVSLLREDALVAMPPIPNWYKGREAIGVFLAATLFAGDPTGRWKLLPTKANGSLALGFYQQMQPGGPHVGAGVQVITLDGESVSEIMAFMNPELLPHFGLPAAL